MGFGKVNFMAFILLASLLKVNGQQNFASDYTGIEYKQVKSGLASGWNTWNTNSVLSHVLLPEAISIDLYIKDQSGAILKEALMGKKGNGVESVFPVAHTYDGSYTELIVEWNEVKLKIQSTAKAKELCLLITPLKANTKAEIWVVPQKIWWKRQGNIRVDSNRVLFELPSGNMTLYPKGEILQLDKSLVQHLAFSAGNPIGLTTNANKSAIDIRQQIETAKATYEQNNQAYKGCEDVHAALQNVLAWDMIYEPEGQRELTTVSRLWNGYRGGFVIFLLG